MKKYLSIALAILLVLGMLAGCGAASKNDGALGAPMENGTGGLKSESVTQDSISDASGSTSEVLPQNQKMIRKFYLDAETEDMTVLLAGVKSRIAELGGYIEAENIHNGSNYSGSRRYRYANLTIRIPADKLDEFVQNVSDSANITSSEQTLDDVTLSYVATESRIKALETEQARLLELLAKAETMEDILKIESRLTDIRNELEQVNSQLRVYDNKVNYGTVHLNISEVKEFTVVEEPETVWQRISAGFKENLKNMGDFFVELFVFIVTAMPYLVPLAAVVVAIILLARTKRRNKEKVQKETNKNQE